MTLLAISAFATIVIPLRTQDDIIPHPGEIGAQEGGGHSATTWLYI